MPWEKQNNDKFVFDNLYLENSNEEVILGITLHNKLTFNIALIWHSPIKVYIEKLVKDFEHY